MGQVLEGVGQGLVDYTRIVVELGIADWRKVKLAEVGV